VEEDRFRNYGPRAAAYISVLGWVNLVGRNLGGLIWLWFASELRNNRNGYRKASIVLLGIYLLIPVIIPLDLLLDRANPPSMMVYGEHVQVGAILLMFFAVAVAAVHLPPMIWLLAPGTRAAFERRVERGLCARCGYDLRAAVDRCPECGMAVPGVRV
jgi:hypothetical protein